MLTQKCYCLPLNIQSVTGFLGRARDAQSCGTSQANACVSACAATQSRGYTRAKNRNIVTHTQSATAQRGHAFRIQIYLKTVADVTERSLAATKLELIDCRGPRGTGQGRQRS